MGAGAGGNFNWIAPVYDTLAFIVFGQRLKKAQTVFLDSIPANASVLIVGGGTGWLLEQVLVSSQPNRIVYLEPSSRMVAKATQRIIRKALVGSVEFRIGDESSLKPDERFNVILTPFVLDLFSEQTLQSHFLPTLRNALQVDGVWIVTDFVNPQVVWQKALLWTMIRFFRLTAGIQANHLANWQKLLIEAGLRCEQRQCQAGGMVSTEVWEREPVVSGSLSPHHR